MESITLSPWSQTCSNNIYKLFFKEISKRNRDSATNKLYSIDIRIKNKMKQSHSSRRWSLLSLHLRPFLCVLVFSLLHRGCRFFTPQTRSDHRCFYSLEVRDFYRQFPWEEGYSECLLQIRSLDQEPLMRLQHLHLLCIFLNNSSSFLDVFLVITSSDERYERYILRRSHIGWKGKIERQEEHLKNQINNKKKRHSSSFMQRRIFENQNVQGKEEEETSCQ